MKKKTCGECKYRYSYHHDEDCDGRCKLSPLYRIPSDKPACSEFEPKPKPTNGDKIRQMSNEKLLDFFTKRNCPPVTQCPCGVNCPKCWLDWLDQEAKDEL